MVTIFKEKGFSPFLQEYLDRWLHTNQIVQVSEREHSTETIPATIKGLTLTGCLLAESCMNGERLELYPDGNSFDFLTGLLKRKL
jgi:biotin--protein ligase